MQPIDFLLTIITIAVIAVMASWIPSRKAATAVETLKS
jgi:ABC-type lipoprotein release transport system permease subunit